MSMTKYVVNDDVESDNSEYESDHEEDKYVEIQDDRGNWTGAYVTDWKGNEIDVTALLIHNHAISAYKFSRGILKRYKYNRRVAKEMTGWDLPLTLLNVKKQYGKIHKNSSTICGRKGRLVFP